MVRCLHGGIPSTFYSIRSDMRYIHHIVNMGCGNFTLQEVRVLFFRLEDAFSWLSGMQQNGGMGTEYRPEEDEQAEREIQDILRDLMAAFGYDPSKVKFEKQEWETAPTPNKLLDDMPPTEAYAYVNGRVRKEGLRPPDPQTEELVGIVKFDTGNRRLMSLATTLFEKIKPDRMSG